MPKADGKARHSLAALPSSASGTGSWGALPKGAGKKASRANPERTKYFAAREVQNRDGIGPRGGGEGLHRKAIEKVLDANPLAKDAAKALVRRQVKGVTPGEYQDNVGVAVLDVSGP